MSSQQERQETRRPYSYHTFIFPFLFQDGGKNVGRKKFTKCLNKGFYQDIFKSRHGTQDTVEYARFRYFNQAARNAIYMDECDDSAVVWNYRFNIEAIARNAATAREWVEGDKKENNPARMIITKGQFIANLAVNDIRLKLFDTGVGMLIFELENYELPDETSVKKINEYGRRVFTPFITPEGDCSLYADEMKLIYHNDVIVPQKETCDNIGKTDEIVLSPIVRYFLKNGDITVTTASKVKKNEFRIEPIIDDRMFVACVYNMPEFAKDICAWDAEQGQYKYISDAMTADLSKENTARRFYEMVFVDGDGLTCQNRTKLTKMNEDHSFARWIEYGTLTGMSEYSMVCMTGDGTDVYNINPFLTEYVEMIILVLAQRASLLAFERAISEVTCKKNYKLNIEKIHRKYVAFESELLLSEVTSQQQGIELYDMMLKNLFIDKLTEDLDGQIKSLYELHTADHERMENLLLDALAVVGAADIVSVILNEVCNWNRLIGLACGAALGSAILLLVHLISSPIKRKF
jgi:hypothetical protein